MADFLYVHVLFCILMVEGVQRHISGLYCQDPDTGKLYEINSTWPSESFCGNYTCKLSKKNVTETEYTPIIKVNITDIMFGDKKDEIKQLLGIKSNITNQILNTTNANTLKEIDSNNITDMAISPSEVTSTINKVPSIVNPIPHHSNIKIETDDTDIKNIDKNDRYLTEPEIKVITDILHTVKKSDLEAIVDIYKLALEIYNELESTTEKAELTTGQLNSNRNFNKMPYKEKNKDTYRQDSLPNSKDMKTESTSLSKISRIYSYPTTYFRGGLPYYYPMSDFHRMLSYAYTMPPKSKTNMRKQCSKQISNNINTPRYNTLVRSTRANIVQKTSATMLPFPFSNVRHNISDYVSNYYNTYPWAQLDMYNRKRYYVPNYLNTFYPQATNTFQVEKPTKSEKKIELKIKEANQRNKCVEKGSLGKNKKNIEIKQVRNKLPEWKTGPLSPQVIEEVRANVMDNTKLLNVFPWKGIQLDRVGKVIKLDELLKPKRHVENDQADTDYEAQLEKIECETDTDIGFFSYGNLTEPYPECCPKKISAEKVIV